MCESKQQNNAREMYERIILSIFQKHALKKYKRYTEGISRKRDQKKNTRTVPIFQHVNCLREKNIQTYTHPYTLEQILSGAMLSLENL